MNYNDENLLEMVELYAEEMGHISSEQELSDKFDAMVEELNQCPNHIDTDDSIMMSEWFNDWTDSLCKDGEIHPEQYNQYCYVGEYS